MRGALGRRPSSRQADKSTVGSVERQNMAHEHAHQLEESYYLDQLCTIASCGLLGGIGFLLWKTDALIQYNILSTDFRIWTLFGAVVLFGITAIRGIALWSEVGRNKLARAHEHDHNHDHHHKHGETCAHDHGHDHDHHHEHGHEDGEHTHAHLHHDHGHSHAFAPWRYAVLLMPLMLAALLIYYHYHRMELTYSTPYLMGGKAEEILNDSGNASATKNDAKEIPLGFQTLTQDAPNPALHAAYEGNVGTLKGLYKPITDKQFSLMRLKMTCCRADAVPLKVRLISPEPLDYEPRNSVEV